MKDEIIGKRFNKLTPIKRIGGPRNKYLCKCDCGNTSEVCKYNIVSGITKSCGCIRGIKNIIGKKFNKLTVIREHGRDKSGRLIYLCRCDCGNETIVNRSNIMTGCTKSCGCLRRDRTKDISGNKYNLLTVIEKHSVVDNVHYYKCDCDCGTKGVIVSRKSLVSGNTKSCGCLRKKANRIKFIEENKINE